MPRRPSAEELPAEELPAADREAAAAPRRRRDPCVALREEALAAPLLREPRLGMRLIGRTDTLLACFPGKSSPGARYNCHYDGGAGDARKLTAILYPNEGWQEEDGGALQMYDGGGFGADGPTERCWRSVQPRAGRLLLFRSDRVLHKVMPAFATRYALTMFHAAKFGKERGQANLPPAQQGQGGLGAVQVKDPGVAMQVW